MIKLGSLFSGIGAWEVALKELGIEHELKFFCEFDKYASKAYSIIHNESENKNLGDVTQIDTSTLPDIDMLVYSPPCQAFSVAGNMKGFEDKRGILFFDAMRIIKAKKPQYALMENVKGLTTKKFKAEFGEMLKALSEAGYTNYWMVLNTKNYGIPQNRERVFVISMLEDKGFNKPTEIHNGLVLRDMLEDEVDEKYYLSQDKVDKLIANLKDERISKKLPKGDSYNIIGSTQNADAQGTNSRHWTYDIDSNISCLSATDYKQPKQIAISTPSRLVKHQNGRRVKNEGEPMFTLTSQDIHGVVEVPIKNATKKGYELATENDSINISYPNSKTRRGRVQKDRAGTLETGCNQGVLSTSETQRNFRIRKLTVKECWRLQGFSDGMIDKCIDAGISNTQLYKMAGNSISVCVVKAIFKELLKKGD